MKVLSYPGLTSLRRVVLDLSFRGYGLSSEIVDTHGELLGIAEPDAKFDPVPGAIVVRQHLGNAVQKLLADGARFDLIVGAAKRGSGRNLQRCGPPKGSLPKESGRNLQQRAGRSIPR